MWIWIGVHPFGVMIVDIGGVNMKLKFIEKKVVIIVILLDIRVEWVFLRLCK